MPSMHPLCRGCPYLGETVMGGPITSAMQDKLRGEPELSIVF